MKETIKRLASCILVFAMICSLIPMSALAVTPDDSKKAPAAQTQTYTYINPLYSDVITEADLVQPRESAASQATSTDPDYSTTYEEAGLQIREGLKQRQETVVAYYQSTDFDLETDCRAIMAAAMEHTGVPKEGDSLRWVYAGFGAEASWYKRSGVYYITLTYTMTYYTTAAQEKELDTAVDELLAQVDQTVSDYQKLRSVYDYICENIYYDDENLEDDSYKLKYTAYAALINKTAVCQGYAALLYRLALELGIDCRLIAGTGNGGAHGWNIVKLGRVYYDVDSTWDATWMQQVGYYNYFLQCEETFTEGGTDHIRNEEYTTAAFMAAYPMAETDYDPNAQPDEPITSGTCGDNLTWTLVDGTLTISGTGKMYDFSSGGAPWNDKRGEILSVVIEQGVTGIGSFAFSDCSNMTNVSIGNNVTSIGNHAFQNCNKLPSITILDSVTSIGDYAFDGCESLTGITISDSVTSFGDYAFSSCVNLPSITIPAGVTSIGCYTFQGCSSLTGVSIPDSVTIIGESVFASCSSLTSVSIPDSVTNIDVSAFAHCSSLTSINIPDSVTSIGFAAFYDCNSLTSIDIPDSVTSIGEWAFGYCSSLTEITFDGNAPSIGENAFSSVTATAYYPANNETWTSDVMQDYGGTITWVPYSNASEPTVTYKSASISLAGDIGVNYYVQLSDDIVADEGSYMQFTVAGQTQTIPVSQAVTKTEDDGSVTYRFSCKVAAKQMTDTIVGQMYTSNGPVGASKSYSVRAYCDMVIKTYSENEAYANLVALMRDMLNYGAYSQIQFAYNTENLANAGLEDTTLPELTADNLAAYAHGATGSEEGISISSVSLLLESTTTIRFYFKLDGTKTIDEYTFYVDGTEVKPVQYDADTYYVDKANVAAKDLDEMATVTVGGLTARYCGLSYVRQVAVLYPSNYGENLVNVAKALYAYNDAANTYFGA